MKRAAALALLLAGCGQTPTAADGDDGARLEAAAIRGGLVRDPAATALTGLYARDTDRVCVVPATVGYRIGVAIDYGGGQACSASGTVARSGEALSIDLGGDCAFDARLDGEAIVFPASLPASCDRLCSDRASLTAIEVDLQSQSPAEASALRDARGRTVCAGS